MRIRISADSTCDLPQELVDKYGVSIVPIYIVKNGVPYHDHIDITPDDIFDCVERMGGVCHTAAVNSAEYGEIFAEYLKDCDAVIHINISSGMSCCIQNAQIAAREFKNVFIVDSKNLSTGSGLLVLEAARMAALGAQPQEIVDRLNELAHKVEASFVIDTLKYLYRGGRCSGLAALGANLLQLKPCIEVTDGKMDVGKKYRGSFDKVIMQYVREKLSGRDDIDPGRIFITYVSRTPMEVVDNVADAVKSMGYFDEVLTSVAGCTISTHGGPVCLGVLYMRK